MNKKIIFILIDGIADIEKVTCLDKANIPTIDLLAKSGKYILNRHQWNNGSSRNRFSLWIRYCTYEYFWI